MHILNQSTLDRRTFLRAGAVSLALPLLDAMIPIAYGQTSRAKSAALQPRRMVLIHRPLGTYHPHLVPTATGLNYEATRFLQKLEPHRGRFTLFSGMGHPDYPNSHNTEPAIFTGVPEFHEHDLHNTVSLDQVAAQKVGSETRFPYLLLNKVWSQSLSWNEKGVESWKRPCKAPLLPAILSISIPIVIRLGKAWGLMITSGDIPLSLNGISVLGQRILNTPFCP